MTDLQCLQNMMKNIEIERTNLGYTQAQMAKAIGMSLSSYKRMLVGEMNLKASIVIKNLYMLTGKFCGEFMELSDPNIEMLKQFRKLSTEQQEAILNLIYVMIKKEGRDV